MTKYGRLLEEHGAKKSEDLILNTEFREFWYWQFQYLK